jgi:putative DNA primase/helicase
MSMKVLDDGGATVTAPGLAFELTPASRGRTRVVVRSDGKPIFRDLVLLEAEKARRKVARKIAALSGGRMSVRRVDRFLLDEIDALGAPPAGPDAATGQPIEAPDDPDRLARLFLDAGGPPLCYHRDTWYVWRRGTYRDEPRHELDARVVPCIKAEFDRVSAETGKTALQVTQTLVGNVRLALAGHTIVAGSRDLPCWLGDAAPFPAPEALAARNGIFHLPALAEGRAVRVPPTPDFFSTVALDYDIEIDPPRPATWLKFLDQVFPGDPHAVELLQEFFGYVLTSDTSYQKMLVILGPTRSGKGTIGRVLTGLVGPWNVAGPTAGSLKKEFGLQPLLGKPLAIMADAQVKHHDDALVERLKAISGEDLITVDRKHASAVTVKLPTRFVIMSNDLPRFKDASGALANRMLVLRMTQSFLGREDTGLGARLLAERPGILMWAIAGWKRLGDRGRFVQPASGAQLAEELHALSSPLRQFVAEWCRVEPGARVPRQALYEAYQRWCVGQGIDHPLHPTTFGAELRSVVPTLGDAHPDINGKRVRCYTGIVLLD